MLTGGSEACVTEEELSVADEIAGLGFVCDALARGVISDRDPEAPMAAASPLGRLVFESICMLLLPHVSLNACGASAPVCSLYYVNGFVLCCKSQHSKFYRINLTDLDTLTIVACAAACIGSPACLRQSCTAVLTCKNCL